MDHVTRLSRTRNLLLVAASSMLASCGDGGTDPMMMVGDECTDFSECGGANNKQGDPSCTYCFFRPDTEVCEAGVCRVIDASGTIEFRFVVPREGAGAPSYTYATFLPVTGDGRVLDCAGLTGNAAAFDDLGLNATNSSHQQLGSADPSILYRSFTSAEPGSDRLLLVTLTSGERGGGDIVAQGCLEGLEIKAGETTLADLGTLKAR